MKDLNNKVAVVTGAASGIGRALALQLAGEGCHLAISDVNEAGLAETAAMIKNTGLTVSTRTVDVADRDQVFQFAEAVMKDHHRVDIVINNAGTSLAGSLEEVSTEEFEWLMGINFWGVVYGSMAFLPHLKQQPEASLVNISSVHGLFTNPGVGPYCSSKFAVKGFTQTLCQEMRQTPVVVSSVHPGGIRTSIVVNARIAEKTVPEKSPEEAQADFDKFLGRTSAEEAARIIVHGIKKKKTRILVGKDAYIFDLASRLLPVTWQRFMGWLPDFMAKSGK